MKSAARLEHLQEEIARLTGAYVDALCDAARSHKLPVAARHESLIFHFAAECADLAVLSGRLQAARNRIPLAKKRGAA